MEKRTREEEQMLLFNFKEKFHPHIMKLCEVDEQYVRDGVKALMDWYEAQPHLPKYLLDWDFIEGCYAYSKFSMEKTKQKIDCFLTIRNVFPEFFTPRDPKSEAIQLGNLHTQCYQIPKLTKDGSKVAVIRITDRDPKDYDPYIGFNVLFMTSEIRYFLDQAASEILIFDCEYLSMGHVMKMTPTFFKKVAFMFQNVYTFRLQAIHLINLNKYALKIGQLARSLFSEKLAKRMFFHEKVESLKEHIPEECLVNELGGTAGEYRKFLENYYGVIESDHWREWYIRSGTELVDESKRPTKTDKYDEFFGVVGSFRTLTLD